MRVRVSVGNKGEWLKGRVRVIGMNNLRVSVKLNVRGRIRIRARVSVRVRVQE